MAVYTHITEEHLKKFLTTYDIGALIAWKGIAEGIENSNYYVETDRNRFILTLYEKRVNPLDLPFFLTLKQHLASKNFPCPLPIINREGKILSELEGRPAAMVSFLSGKSTRTIRNAHIVELGKAMAQMHLAGANFTMSRENDFGFSRWQGMFDPLRASVDKVRPGLEKEMSAQLAFLAREWPKNLPRGVIHADMFPDNVFFENDELSGVIDFYFACTDFLAYDIAIALNAWCFERHNEFNITKAKLLLSAYSSVRPLSEQEIDAMPILAAGAAMRFLLTRMHDWLNRVEGALVTPKNPLEYWERLCFHKGLTHASAYGF
ncbi:MAG: thrB [Rickettsiales bacterium]|jgi:homoserine kinase type II|nr:thrB [Rickettsiales bacterium]